MAIGRLLSPKLTPHFNKRGFIPLTRRWLSSSLEDGRKHGRLPDSGSSTNKDIGHKGVHWYSLGGLLTNLKQKIMGNVLLMDKTSGEDSVSPKSPIVSSPDVTATKVVTLQNVAESENCIPSSIKEESSVSEMGSQDASQSVTAENKNCITSSIKEESSVSEMGPQDASQSVTAENKNCITSSIKEESSVSEMGPQNASQSVSAENKNCITSSINEEPSISEMGFQGVSQSVAANETSGKRESISVNIERLDNINRVDGLEFVQEKVLSWIQAERVDPPEEPSSKDVALGFLTEEVSESLTSSGENMGKLQPEKGQSDQRKPPQNRLSNLFVNSDPYKEVKLSLRFEALSNSNSSMSTGEFCSDGGDQHGRFGKMLSDPVQKIESISKENDKDRLSDAPQNPGCLTSILLRGGIHDQSGDLTAIRERKSIFSFESSKKPDAPLAVSSMKKLMDSLNLPTENGTGTDANSLNPNGREEICLSKDIPAMQKCDRFCATEEEESKGETLVMENQSLCSQASLAATTVNPKTNTAVKNALKKGSVTMSHDNAVVESTSQEDMVERICIPDLIGDPDVPIALVKEPARTVKIHPLMHDISSNQIKEALRFCRSDISRFILGSSRTDAFVEFEAEDGKERALAEHSITIFNKQLFITRIDIPRTTVARISNLSKSAIDGVRALCVPYGQIKQVYNRGNGVVDVHFDVSEWPNMLTILNSLNGMEINGKKLVVRPATVIPPEILRVLWKDPQEKRYVKSVIQNLVREIEQPVDATRCHTLLTDLLL